MKHETIMGTINPQNAFYRTLSKAERREKERAIRRMEREFDLDREQERYVKQLFQNAI